MSGRSVSSGVEPASRADARRNRAKVLRAARAAFAEAGLEVSLGAVARRAGVGAGTVYRHFPRKEDLLEAVLSQRIEGLARLAAESSRAADPGAAFYEFMTTVITSAPASADLCAIFDQGDGWPKTVMLAARRRLDQALGLLLATAQRAGAVRGDVDSADVRALITGCVAMQRFEGSAETLGKMTAVTIDMLRPALTTKPASVGRPDAETSNESPNRNETGRPVSRCPMCHRPVPVSGTGRPARYCGSACRQKAHRRRTRTARDASIG